MTSIINYELPKIKDKIIYIDGVRQKKSMTNRIKYNMPNIYKKSDNYKKWLKECEEVKKKYDYINECFKRLDNYKYD
jgi:hypothetical protein